MVSGGDVGFVGAKTARLIPTNLLSLCALTIFCQKRGNVGLLPDILMTHIISVCGWSADHVSDIIYRVAPAHNARLATMMPVYGP